jgi:hypothetical protein
MGCGCKARQSGCKHEHDSLDVSTQACLAELLRARLFSNEFVYYENISCMILHPSQQQLDYLAVRQ